MSFMKDLMSTPNGKITLSIIWGLGLAALFRKACKGRNCIVIRGPKPAEMDDKIYGFENKCYKYSSEVVQCKATDVKTSTS